MYGAIYTGLWYTVMSVGDVSGSAKDAAEDGDVSAG